jgi:hypothetical protein
MIALVLVPHKRFGRYVALLDGQPIIKPTRQPFFNAARELMARGYLPETELSASHQDGPTTDGRIVAMRSTIGEAAKWTIHESDRGGLQKRLWKAYEDIHSRQDEAPENGIGEVERQSIPDRLSSAGEPTPYEQTP